MPDLCLHLQLVPVPFCPETFLGAQESIPSLAGRYDNPLCRTGPPGYIGWPIDSSESIPGLHKRLQIRALVLFLKGLSHEMNIFCMVYKVLTFTEATSWNMFELNKSTKNSKDISIHAESTDLKEDHSL